MCRYIYIYAHTYVELSGAGLEKGSLSTATAGLPAKASNLGASDSATAPGSRV